VKAGAEKGTGFRLGSPLDLSFVFQLRDKFEEKTHICFLKGHIPSHQRRFPKMKL
jgi:hypothetical protein